MRRTLKEIEALEEFQRDTGLTYDALETAYLAFQQTGEKPVDTRQCEFVFMEHRMSDLDMLLRGYRR